MLCLIKKKDYFCDLKNKAMMRKLMTLLAMLALVLAGCKNDEPDTPPTPARRTILVYMVATNSLGNNHRDLQDLDEMDQAVEAGALDGCRLLVYRVGPESDYPTLFEIKQNKKGRAVHDELEAYAATEGASVTPARMREVIDDMRADAPASEYGLVLWSHGTGWAQSITTRAAAPRRLFGDDNGAHMTLTELAQGIPAGLFRWIYADVCYMGCVEVAYELRDRCQQLVAYPTEIPAKGMPYDLTLPLLCKPTAQLAQACQATYDYYNVMTDQNRTFAGVVVDCTQLDAMADVCRRIQADARPLASTSGLQCYNINGSRFFFDFLQYYQTICPAELQDELTNIYNKAVVYKVATPAIFNRVLIDPAKYSGLSTYVPGTSPGVNDNYYAQLAWHQAVF